MAGPSIAIPRGKYNIVLWPLMKDMEAYGVGQWGEENEKEGGKVKGRREATLWETVENSQGHVTFNEQSS